jgi:hypothetical protein
VNTNITCIGTCEKCPSPTEIKIAISEEEVCTITEICNSCQWANAIIKLEPDDVCCNECQYKQGCQGIKDDDTFYEPTENPFPELNNTEEFQDLEDNVIDSGLLREELHENILELIRSCKLAIVKETKQKIYVQYGELQGVLIIPTRKKISDGSCGFYKIEK